MSAEPSAERRTRRPRKVVVDEARAERVIEELRDASNQIQAATRRRLELAYEANRLGMTTTKIGEAVNANQTTVAAWVRAGREITTTEE